MSKALKAFVLSAYGDIKLDNLTPNEEKKIISKYEKFLSNSLFFYTTNFDEIGKKNNRRLLILVILKVCPFLHMARSVVHLLWPTPFVTDLTCNAYHYLGNPVVLDNGESVAMLSCNLSHGALHQYYNIYGRSRMFWLMNKIKNRGMEYKLNHRFNLKFYRRLNIIGVSLNIMFIFNWLSIGVLLSIPSIIGYFDDQHNFTPIGKEVLIFKNIIFNSLNCSYVCIQRNTLNIMT